MALGAKITLRPTTSSQAPSTNILPACAPNMFKGCPTLPKELLPPGLDERGGGMLGLNKFIATGREQIWPAVIQMSGQSPIWGHGLGTSPGAYLNPPYTGQHTHNGFLQVYYQFGIIGVALYVLLWVLLFIRAIGVENIRARSAAVAVLSAACVLDTFELVFIQSNLGIGMALAILATTEFTQRTIPGYIKPLGMVPADRPSLAVTPVAKVVENWRSRF